MSDEAVDANGRHSSLWRIACSRNILVSCKAWWPHVLSTVIMGLVPCRQPLSALYCINRRPSRSTASQNLLPHPAAAALCVVVMWYVALLNRRLRHHSRNQPPPGPIRTVSSFDSNIPPARLSIQHGEYHRTKGNPGCHCGSCRAWSRATETLLRPRDDVSSFLPSFAFDSVSEAHFLPSFWPLLPSLRSPTSISPPNSHDFSSQVAFFKSKLSFTSIHTSSAEMTTLTIDPAYG